jgi:hypothetical protein
VNAGDAIRIEVAHYEGTGQMLRVTTTAKRAFIGTWHVHPTASDVLCLQAETFTSVLIPMKHVLLVEVVEYDAGRAFGHRWVTPGDESVR